MAIGVLSLLRLLTGIEFLAAGQTIVFVRFAKLASPDTSRRPTLVVV
jgi:hypothetical protein